MAAHERRVRCATEGEGLCISLFGGWLGFEGSRSSFTLVLLAWLSQTMAVCHSHHPREDCVEYGCNFPLMFSVLTSGSNACCAETDADIHVLYCVHGHSSELLLTETAKSLGVELAGDLRALYGLFRGGHRLTQANM